MSDLRIVSVVGARPQFVKAATVSAAISKRGNSIEEILIHTGQHYDVEMSDIFFERLSIRPPDRHLGVGSGPHGKQTGAILVTVEGILSDIHPDAVVVYGDTNSTLAGAIAAAKLCIPIAHVEAGLRSWRRDMPEEVNRAVSDHLSTLLFCPTETAVANLAREGIVEGVELVGDVMFDLLKSSMTVLDPSSLTRLGLKPAQYAVATVHRAANTDDTSRLRSIVAGFARIAAAGLPLVFPVHPRTRALLESWPIPAGIHMINPVGYEDMLVLEQHARVILTDSGGVQKEAYWLGVPCVTLRDETEWPETLQGGWNVLAGTDPTAIVRAAARTVPAADRNQAFGKGDAADRIVELLLSWAQRATAWSVA